MDAATHRTAPAEQAAFAAALMAAVCAIGSLALAAGLAFAWLADQARISNDLALAPVEAPIEEPYAALYEDVDGTGTLLVFDRGDEVPESLAGRSLTASWRGMETGSEDFSRPGVLPWSGHTGSIARVACGRAAQEHPIQIFCLQNFFRDMTVLTCADVTGIAPSRPATQNASHPSKSLHSTFLGCASLERVIGLETWDVSEINDIGYLFCNCHSLRALDLTAWDPKNIELALCSFYACSSLVRLDITGWNMESCTRTWNMLAFCTSLSEIVGLETLRCPRLRDMDGMLAECSSLERIDLSGLDIPGNGALNTCMAVTDGCSSLRYLDLSGIRIDRSDQQSLYMYPRSPTLETVVLSNQIRTGRAPVPATPLGLGSNMESAGYWICEETGESFGQHALMKYVDSLYSYSDDVEKVTFHAFRGGWGDDDPYAAAYQKEDGNMLLIMDRGSVAPDVFEGLPLVLEVRDFTVDGEHGSAAWRSLPVSEARILADLKPATCRRWFYDMFGLVSLEGLEHLDMSACADVTEMFQFIGAKHLAVEGWKVRADAESLPRIFACCHRLLDLDLSQWTVDLELNLAQLDHLIELVVPSNMRLSRLDHCYNPTVVRFDDGYWYANGLGEPLHADEVRAAVNTAYGSGSVPVRYAHEKEDRSYAALYRGAAGDVLMFGRGLDVPETHRDGTLQASYRGLEEHERFNITWNDFKNGACPWTGFADSIIAVECDDAARMTPIRPYCMDRWFQNMGSLKEAAALEAGALDPVRVKSASWLFFSCTSLERVPSSFSTSFTDTLTDAMGMYGYCSTLTSLTPLDPASTGRLWDATQMFEGCSSLTSLDLSAWNISSLRRCSSMFRGCWALETLSLPDRFVAPERESALQLAFLECSSLRELDGSTWDLSGTTTLFHAFNECIALERISGAEQWDTGAVVTMNSAFRLCRALTLDCSGWNIGSVTDSDSFALGAPGVTSPFEAAAMMEEEPAEGPRADGPDSSDGIRADSPGEDAPVQDADQGGSPGTGPGQGTPGTDASEDPVEEQPPDPEEGGPESGEAPPLTQESA